jgi:hypothetical protein
MILVDSSHPDQTTRFAAIGIEQEIPPKQIRPLIVFFSLLGTPGRFKGPQYDMPLEVYEAEQAYLPPSSVAWFDERIEGLNSLAQAGQFISLGDIPLIMLSSARPPIRATQIPARDPQDLWLDLQQELTLLSTNSEIRKLEEVGHYIQFGDPSAVIEAVQEVGQQCAATLAP